MKKIGDIEYNSANYSVAFEWYTKAAQQGEASGMYSLANMYRDGEGVTPNDEEAIFWYSKAANAGFDKAMYSLGLIYENKDSVKAVEWYTKAAQQGHPKAMCNLGIMYYSGNGVTKDLDIATEWIRKSALLGQEEALYNMGVISDSKTESAMWYRKAAAKNYSDAMQRLSKIYEQLLCGSWKFDEDITIAFTADGNWHITQENTQSFAGTWKIEQGYILKISPDNNTIFSPSNTIHSIDQQKWEISTTQKNYILSRHKD